MVAWIDPVMFYSSPAQKAVRDSFWNRAVALAERFQMFSLQDVAIVSIYMHEAARNAITSVHSDAGHRLLTIRERLKKLVGQGSSRCQDDLNRFQDGFNA